MVHTSRTKTTGVGGLLLLIFSFTQPALPAEHDDFIFVVRNHTLAFDPIRQQADDRIQILQQPEYGDLNTEADGAMSYHPHGDICQEHDRFVYATFNGDAVERVTVHVEILCEALTIIAGFTPNGDGVNDFFEIKGVQNFPGNELHIFNKWGEPVFSMRDYDNSWDGTDPQTGASLANPDAVFYYVFDNGTGEIFSGYLRIGETV